MKKLNIKKVILSLIILIVIFVVVFMIVTIVKNNLYKKKVLSSEYNTYEDFKKPKEYIIYRGGTFIEQKDSKEENIQTDIYLNFNITLDDNEDTYKDIIAIVAYTLNYQNFRLIDEKQELVITVYCQDSTVRRIFYNGEENYFEKQKSKKMLQDFKYNEGIDMNIQSNLLKNVINNDWAYSKIDFGERTKVENSYDIFKNKNIMVRNVAKKIFNIVFTQGYKESVVNDIKVGASQNEIIEKLGQPDFNNGGLIGYKGKDIYVFFTSTSISVYRVEKSEEGYDEFLELIKNFRENRNVKSLINKLTDIWGDYNKYEVDSEYVNIQYALRGFEIQFNVTSEHGLIVYNNYKGKIDNDIDFKDLSNFDKEIPLYTYIKGNEDLINKCEIDRCFTFGEISS